MTKTIQEEVDQNYEAFEKLLPELLRTNRGKFALMKDKKVVGYYSSALDARSAAELAFHDNLFSIQHITDNSINLGFYTDAVLDIRIQSNRWSNNTGSGVPA